MRLARLFVYPIKSAAGLELQSARVDDFGLEHDRRWLIVDESGLALTQREEPRLALVNALPTLDGLGLSAENYATLAVQRPTRGMKAVTVWDDIVAGIDAGAPAAQWLSDLLGR